MAAGGWRLDVDDQNDQHTFCDVEVHIPHLLTENLENDEENRNILVSSINVGRENASAARRRVQHIENTAQCVKILFAGKTGAGKSSLINGLVGKKIAEEGAGAKPVTGISTLENPYECEIQTDDSSVQIQVWDSPGLQDGYQDDGIHLERLRVTLSQVDLLVYCINSNDRFDNSAQTALREFALLKPDIWSHTVIALTRANSIIHPGDNPTEEEKTTYFDDIMTRWNLDICKVLQQCHISRDVIDTIPFVPTGYHRVTDNTPHPWYLHSQCNHWFQPFWVNCLLRCKERGQQALVASNRHRFSFNDTRPGDSNTLTIEEQPIHLGSNSRKFAEQASQETQSNDPKIFSLFVWLWHAIFKSLLPTKKRTL